MALLEYRRQTRNFMNVHPNELPAKGFVQLDKLSHAELVPFIQRYLKTKTLYSILYYVSNMITFAVAGFLFVRGYSLQTYDIGERFTHFSFGLSLAIALLPMHEYIHVLAYKSQGARKTSYAANLKKFYFMALADKFVANKKEFEIVALAPFVIITSLLVVLMIIVPADWTLTIAGTLL